MCITSIRGRQAAVVGIFRQRKQLGLKTLITLHVTGNVCMRGTMLFEGRAAWSMVDYPKRCASCFLAAVERDCLSVPQGAWPSCPGVLSTLAAGAAQSAQRWPPTPSLQGAEEGDRTKWPPWADRIVAPCSWLYGALLSNGVSAKSLSSIVRASDTRYKTALRAEQ